VAEVKAIACQLPSERGVPLSRFSSAEIAREAVVRGIVEQVSGATVWRWLAEDAIRPWNYRSWIFPRDPDFRAKAARVLDLYAGRFEGTLLHPGEFVLCADEKPSIQARARLHSTAAPLPGGDGQLVEHEYERMGALCYLGAWDVRQAKLFDRCEPKGGIEPFDRLVAQVMTQEPYASARARTDRNQIARGEPISESDQTEIAGREKQVALHSAHLWQESPEGAHAAGDIPVGLPR
jgi:hypothetical protein